MAGPARFMHPGRLSAAYPLRQITKMNPLLESTDGPAARNHAPAFTLVELQLVISIIAVLAGLLLPAVQRTREADNEAATEVDMRQILAAENVYFQTNHAFTTSLSA